MSKITVIFQPEGKRVEIEKDNSILSAALKAGTDLTSICGGKGKCGKCKVIIDDLKAVNDTTDEEIELLTLGEREKGIRLACFTKVKNDLVVKVPEYSRTGKQRLQIEGIETPIELKPLIKKYYIELDVPTLEEPRADSERIIDYLQTFTVHPNVF